MRQVRLTASAKADFADAYSWYETEQTGLGEEFRRVVEAQLSAIARHPAAYQKLDERFRRAGVRRFPYVGVFEHDDVRVIVHAVFHTSRHPMRLRQGLPGA